VPEPYPESKDQILAALPFDAGDSIVMKRYNIVQV
jgi:hypothetical protein